MTDKQRGALEWAKKLTALEQARTLAGLVEELMGQVPRWVPVTERLPESCLDVLVVYPDRHINMGTAGCDDWLDDDFEYEAVTHWMPLPEPPKEE